ncbi:MAG: 50S ribosomal protein L6, partial [Planctomycetes bacterium]|nr:50S ribosomal protein L6 [Planctomycetota bacterium]
GGDVAVNGSSVAVKGKHGELSWDLPQPVTAALEQNPRQLRVTRCDDQKVSKALHGLSRALIANMVRGVTQPFERRLLIYGTGYNCNVEGRTLLLKVGFMGRGHQRKAQFEVPIPDGLTVTVETPVARGDTDPAKFLVSGCDKQLVGEFAATVRKIRPPEPYKGKGIRYENETVRRKQGKAFASGGA